MKGYNVPTGFLKRLTHSMWSNNVEGPVFLLGLLLSGVFLRSIHVTQQVLTRLRLHWLQLPFSTGNTDPTGLCD